MKRVFLKGITMICVLAMCVSLFISVIPTASAATVIPRPVQIQWTTEWKSVYYGGQSLYDTGCGVFATVNTIGYLTGNEMSITEVAQWAYEIRALNYYAGGIDRTIMYPKLQEKFGKDYGFTVDCAGATGYWSGASSTILKNHLISGGAAIGHVAGHFISVLGYDPSTKYFHVYDSAPSSSRGTGNGDAWVSETWFTTSAAFSLDWFCLVTATGDPINLDYGADRTPTATTANKLGTYRINTEQLNVRGGVGVSYDVVTTVKQNDLVNVTALSDGWGKFVAPDGKEGWANVTTYGEYIGIDALASTQSIAWGAMNTSLDENGALTITNQSEFVAGYDFALPLDIGTATTPYLSLKVRPQNTNGYYFGLCDTSAAYFMMRDSASGDELVESTTASYMTGMETLSINLADWWKPSGGQRIDRVRFYLAPGSTITIDYLYFAVAKTTVTDSSYNLVKNTVTPLNETLMVPSTLTVADRTKTGGYTYQNGVLTVNSQDANGYEVVFEVNKTYSPEQMGRLLVSVNATVRYDIALLVTTSEGDRVVSLTNDYWPELCSALDGGYIPASKLTAGLDLYNCYRYNGILPTDGKSVIKSVSVKAGGVGTVTVDALQIANNDALCLYPDGASRSDSTPDASPSMKGDVNGDGTITTTDARLAMLHAIGSTEITGSAFAMADYNGDGQITTIDARLMMLYALTH